MDIACAAHLRELAHAYPDDADITLLQARGKTAEAVTVKAQWKKASTDAGLKTS